MGNGFQWNTQSHCARTHNIVGAFLLRIYHLYTISSVYVPRSLIQCMHSHSHSNRDKLAHLTNWWLFVVCGWSMPGRFIWTRWTLSKEHATNIRKGCWVCYQQRIDGVSKQCDHKTVFIVFGNAITTFDNCMQADDKWRLFQPFFVISKEEKTPKNSKLIEMELPLHISVWHEHYWINLFCCSYFFRDKMIALLLSLDLSQPGMVFISNNRFMQSISTRWEVINFDFWVTFWSLKIMVAGLY